MAENQTPTKKKVTVEELEAKLDDIISNFSNARKNPYHQFMAEVEKGWKSAEEQGMTDIDEAEMLLGIKTERTEFLD